MIGLENLELREADISKLNKKNIFSVEDVQNFFPRKYYNFSNPTPLYPKYSEQYIAVIGRFDKLETDKKNKTVMLKAKVYDDMTGKKLNVLWIGSYFLKDIIKSWKGEKVIVCGKMTYSAEYHSFHMSNPIIFSNKIKENLKIYPVYTKMSGISEEWMGNLIRKSLENKAEDSIPEDIKDKYKLYGINEALYQMHYPSDKKSLVNAQKRFVFASLYSFAESLYKRETDTSKGTIYNAKTSEYVDKFLSLLPFSLTQSQIDVYEEMKKLASDGRRINALVQGDVGSGKTMIAFLMMFLMAGSGYQSVLMAPTEILARQHYEELKSYADKIGIKVVFFVGSLKAKEKKSISKEIEDGTAKLIVGTHSVVSENLKYKDLALAVVDEEHRFGVSIEESLFSKSDKGMHTISMSATPIPRTIADAIFTDSLLVFDLKRPAGRQEVQTCIFNNDEKIYNFLEKQVKDGRQAYVVCPLIEDSDSDSRKHILSVEAVEDAYKKRFEMNNIVVESVTGKTKKEDAENILKRFKAKEIDILISTTVIEVGVNNPNVSTIVISNAEMFGVAQLHQLRGRVGRGKYKGYCILKSADNDNERLKLLCQTNDGFQLAEKDAELRGPGDILGEKQSGKNKELELVLKYPNMYRVAKKEARRKYII